MNKKQLYESIMKDVSKIIKKHLNENMEMSTLFDTLDPIISDETIQEEIASELLGNDLKDDLLSICEYISNYTNEDLQSITNMFMMNRDYYPYILNILDSIVTDYDYNINLIKRTFMNIAVGR